MNWKNKEKRRLIQAILVLGSEDVAERFLRDLMTETEIIEFANRLEAASLLTQNVSYSRIQKKTGLSATTIARVSKWLGGTEGGYKTIFSRLHHHNSFFEKRS